MPRGLGPAREDGRSRAGHRGRRPENRSSSVRSRSPPCRPATGSPPARRAPSRSATWSRTASACISPATPARSRRCAASPVAVDVALAAGVDVGTAPRTGPSRAALGRRRSLREIGPAVAVPIHWGTLYPRRLHRIWKAPLLEPGERFAGHAAALAPDVDVRALSPGEATAIDLADRVVPGFRPLPATCHPRVPSTLGFAMRP